MQENSSSFEYFLLSHRCRRLYHYLLDYADIHAAQLNQRYLSVDNLDHAQNIP
jgi:hypothetical protein